MSDRTDALVQALFNKPSLQACSLQQVDYLAHQYPYFTTAQLFLLQKAEPASEVYINQQQRVALHFSNPLQLQYCLEPTAFESELPKAELFQNPIAEETAPQTELEKGNEATNAEQSMAVEKTAPAPEPVRQPAPEIRPEPAPLPPVQIINEPKAAAITFEPYHTVDYFASQGIKLSHQEATGDALGKQVKSFTEWLKTMKRLPETAVAQPNDAAGESNVENLAAHSLATADIVTESMAEVWQKQGNTAKAAELYRKLSLQNPAKSAYFAAKIESLKKP